MFEPLGGLTVVAPARYDDANHKRFSSGTVAAGSYGEATLEYGAATTLDPVQTSMRFIKKVSTRSPSRLRVREFETGGLIGSAGTILNRLRN